MSQGMYSAVSGISANQTRMDVISNNIANINTIGFKSSSVNFDTVFANTITGGTAPNGLLGGTNPMQVGSGVVVGEIASNWNQGGTQFTGKNTDLMIQGSGFFTVERVDTNNGNASTDYYLTRAGNFTLDDQGNLVTSAGNRVRGTSEVQGSNVDTLGRVQLPLEFLATKALDANGNVLDEYFSPVGTTAAQIDANFQADMGYNPVAGGGSYNTVSVTLQSFTVGSDGSINGTYSNGDQITVRTDSATVAAATAAGDPTLIRREVVVRPYEGGTYASHTFVAGDNKYGDGNKAAGGANGMCGQHTGNEVFTGGIDPTLWPPGYDPMQGQQLQLQSAIVTNPEGLLYQGNNNFIIGANSGQTDFGVAGNGARGTLQAGALESSNVDMSKEFTDMIITQRGIEAASKVITSQSQIMQTIIQAV